MSNFKTDGILLVLPPELEGSLPTEALEYDRIYIPRLNQPSYISSKGNHMQQPVVVSMLKDLFTSLGVKSTPKALEPEIKEVSVELVKEECTSCSTCTGCGGGDDDDNVIVEEIIFAKPNVSFFRYLRNFTYSGEVSTFGGVTFLIELDYENSLLKFSMARCADDESFNKKVGRRIALNRKESGQFFEMKYDFENIDLVKGDFIAPIISAFVAKLNEEMLVIPYDMIYNYIPGVSLSKVPDYLNKDGALMKEIREAILLYFII